ncbi:MAG: molybdenum cofactor guanylyltransferase [Saprospiraceae bacterium]
MTDENKISIAVLAGGKSSRMKQDKGLVMLNGKRMIEHVLDAARSVTSEIIVIANSDAYQHFSFSCFPDEMTNCGPMGGIFTALKNAKTEKVLVLSCDAPFISTEVIQKMMEQSGGENVLVAWHKGNIHPICAIYSKKCLPILSNKLRTGDFKLKAALEALDAIKIVFDEDEYESAFLNINTPEDLERIQQYHNEK